MAKPTLLTVDDDPEVLRAVERDLRRKYSNAYRILRADSGPTALDTLGQLKQRGETAALFLVDQRMPRMSGVEFLEKARVIYPSAKRVMLTAYADTDAAISAINKVRVDYYLTKPWDPPESNLYPVLDDLLEDWTADFRPPFEGIRVIGHRWSPETHQIKDFLGRNHIPFQWLDPDSPPADSNARQTLDATLAQGSALPVVLFSEGAPLSRPAIGDIAARVGLRTQSEKSFYDLVIVGGGPAGLAAAVYGASEGLNTMLIEREAPGGQAGMSSRIENYLGFPSGLSGGELARRAVTQARRFGVQILSPQTAVRLRVDGPYRMITLQDGGEVSSHAVLISTGLTWRKLDVPGIERLQGAGVYYGAAMTEAISCQDADVFVIGGANSAGQAAVFFSQYARQVNMIVRADSLAKSMSRYLIDQIAAISNIRVETQSEVTEAHGEEHLEAVSVTNSSSGETRKLAASALFIFIGAEPCTGWLCGLLPMDERGYLLSGPSLPRDAKGRVHGWTPERDPFLLETGIPGVFVAGDTRHNSVKRVASGVGEGSICVQMIHQYLASVAP